MGMRNSVEMEGGCDAEPGQGLHAFHMIPHDSTTVCMIGTVVYWKRMISFIFYSQAKLGGSASKNIQDQARKQLKF